MKIKMKLMSNITAILCLATISLVCTSCSSVHANLEKQKYPVEIATTTAVGQYKVVDTGQEKFFNNSTTISKPSVGQPFYGQDAQYNRNQPSYTDNGDGTITDNVSGLIWQKVYEVMTYEEAIEKVKTFNLANQTD